jgi:hypothetical protein
MSMSKSLSPLIPASQVPPPQKIDIEDVTGRPEPRPSRKAKATPSQATGGAKYTNPEYMQLKVYVPRRIKTAAARKWEDSGGRDLSDLIESLLSKYLST